MLLREQAASLRTHLGAEISMHKLHNPTKDNRSPGTGYCSEKDHQNIPPASILGRLGMGGTVDSRWMLKQEFRKDNKIEAVHTDTWEVPRPEDFSRLP